MRSEEQVLDELLYWAHSCEEIRGVMLDGSRANPDAETDIFSDYDLELYVRDVQPFLDSDSWLEAFGPILAHWPSKPPVGDSDGTYRLVIFEDGVRIDFGVWPVSALSRVKDAMILVDKDNALEDARPATFTDYIVQKPTEGEYDDVTSEFWWDATYVAKSLWRDELFHARYMLDCLLRSEYLRKVVEWHIGVEHNWSANPNKYGRWFKKLVRPDVWTEIEGTFAGPSLEENWDALFRTTGVFRRLAVQVGTALGYRYPSGMDERITGYMLKIRQLPRDAENFT